MDVIHNDEKDRYEVKVDAVWFAAAWRGNFNANESIVLLVACHSADGGALGIENSVLGACGGRTGIGYDSVVFYGQATNDLLLLLGRMNGKVDGGTKRKAGEAYDAGGFYSEGHFKKRGKNNTTLCPGVVEYGPEGAVNGSGSVYITLDTHCDTAFAASVALSVDTDPDDDIVISNLRWVEDYELRFDYWTTCEEENPEFDVDLTAAAPYIVAEGGADLHLDGKDDPAGTVSVAPNGDDVDWNIYYPAGR